MVIAVLDGQHRQILDQVLPPFDIESDWDPDLMKPDEALRELAAHLSVSPDVGVVYADDRKVETAERFLYGLQYFPFPRF